MLGFLKRVRGALGNALVWGAGWSGATGVTFGLLRVMGFLPPAFSWEAVLETAVNFGITGMLAGGAFSAVIRLRYHGRDLLEISATRFGVSGGLLAGLFVPALITIGRMATGVGVVSLETLLLSGALATVLGGLTAGGSLKLAQEASLDLLPPHGGSPGLIEDAISSAAGGGDARQH